MIRFSSPSFLRCLSISLILLDCLCSYADAIVSAAKVKQVSWKPRAFVYEGFLTNEECDHLISIAKSELKRSAVADSVSGASKLSEVRTSSGMFINKAKDSIVAGIEDKIASWTFLPKENGEDMQVLRYEHGQKYDPHFDYFADKVNIARGGHRMATVLMYLSDVAKGGETVFPSAEEPLRRRSSVVVDDLSECARKGIAGEPAEQLINTSLNSTIASIVIQVCLSSPSPCGSFPSYFGNYSVKPRRGDALLFFNLLPDATPDPLSLHAGCPVIEGEKWSSTKWIHVDSFDKLVGAGGNCTDEHESCERWAALGECLKNVEYMVGTAGLPGYCRRSCKVC